MAAVSKHLVDPELVAHLDQLAPEPLTREALPRMRQAALELARSQNAAEPPFPTLGVTERRIPGPAGDVRLLVYVPRQRTGPVAGLLWIHGGGYVLGSPDADDLRVKTIADAVGCVVVSVDYRLAPETPHPGPLDDCYAALRWLRAQAADLGVRADRLAIGGASAGGGLAAGLGLLARDRGEVQLAFQLLLVPMLDDRTVTHPDPHPYTGEFTWTAARNAFGWKSLLGHEPGLEGVPAYAAAARAESLEGLPSTFISTGALDLFLEEDLEYARRLTRAGVSTELHVYPGAYHGFSQVADAQVTAAYTRDYTRALQRALNV
jgi:acetyl esterase/lipase